MDYRIRNILFYLIGTLFIVIYAIYNGYPIIYHDLSTYVANGFDLETPIDRPITYCLFVRLFSLNGTTLWFVIVAQSYLVSYLIFKLFRALFTNISDWLVLLIIILLSIFTGLSWTSSQVMPDIFTAILTLIIAILSVSNLNKRDRYVLYLIFFLASSMHLSHISFNLVILFVLFFVKYFFPKIIGDYLSNRRIFFLLLITIVSFSTMLSASAKSKHVFFMGAMVEHGILKTFLDDNCDNTQYKICAFKDSLPKRAYQFVWDESSPLYKVGGWQGSKKEFDQIIYKTLTTPKYLWLHSKASFYATIDQLGMFKINDANSVFIEGSLPYDRIVRYIPGDILRYEGSKQMNDKFGFTKNLNVIFTIIIICSFIVVILFLIKGGIYSGKIFTTLFILLVGTFLNAWVSGTFANAIDRLGCKMIWLIPLIAFIGIISQVKNLRIRK